MLWLSLHLPQLALDIFTRGMEEPHPVIISETQGSRAAVHACNAAAMREGIKPGMALGAARSLLGNAGLFHSRDPALEEAALAQLADWCGQFTSHLSLLPGKGVLLEIGGSLKLFGGPSALVQRLSDGMDELGYRAVCAVAPTPLGAQLLSQAGDGRPVTDRGALQQRLAALPLRLLAIEPALQTALHGMGLHTVGDCLNLPPAGLARRLGPAFIDYLYRALGRRPDPRPAYTPPPYFHSRLVLPAEVEHTQGLLFAIRRLLVELEGALRARGCGTQELQLELHHHRTAASRLDIGLLDGSRDAGHFQELIKTRLERFELPAPVEEIVLRSARFQSLPASEGELFDPDHAPTGQTRAQLVEKLQARLSPRAVNGYRIVADHRPEYAMATCRPGTRDQGSDPSFPPRPLWLLSSPQPLNERDEAPWHHGRLRLLDGPERIESGWWDGSPMRRDYYIAETPRHQRLWIFRTLGESPCWYLHGLFA